MYFLTRTYDWLSSLKESQNVFYHWCYRGTFIIISRNSEYKGLETTMIEFGSTPYTVWHHVYSVYFTCYIWLWWLLNGNTIHFVSEMWQTTYSHTDIENNDISITFQYFIMKMTGHTVKTTL